MSPPSIHKVLVNIKKTQERAKKKKKEKEEEAESEGESDREHFKSQPERYSHIERGRGRMISCALQVFARELDTQLEFKRKGVGGRENYQEHFNSPKRYKIWEIVLSWRGNNNKIVN